MVYVMAHMHIGTGGDNDCVLTLWGEKNEGGSTALFCSYLDKLGIDRISLKCFEQLCAKKITADTSSHHDMSAKASHSDCLVCPFSTGYEFQ
jgi:hypothetical protein